jgi:hypothetical protein
MVSRRYPRRAVERPVVVGIQTPYRAGEGVDEKETRRSRTRCFEPGIQNPPASVITSEGGIDDSRHRAVPVDRQEREIEMSTGAPKSSTNSNVSVPTLKRTR